MRKYFLGSVGKAEAFRKNGDRLELAFVSKTLTDSGLNISTTKDDIRGGTGAPIQFSFFHDPSVEITLTDIVFNHEYITAQLGSVFSNPGDANNVDYITVTKEAGINGQAVLDQEVQPLPFVCDLADKYLVWGSVAGEDNYQVMPIDGDHRTIGGLTPGKKYCFRYLAISNKSAMAEITSTIIPEELFLIITAPIFAGDACSASKGKAAGHITFEVPRFQLNGAQEFAMNMSSNQTMSLAGTALASDSIDCDSMGGKLLRIIEVLDDTDYKQNVVGLIVDEESKEAGNKPSVYGELRDGHLIKLSNEELTFVPALNDGKFEEGTEYQITLNGTSIGEIADIGTAPTTLAVVLHNAESDPSDINGKKLYIGQSRGFTVTPTEDHTLPETITVVPSNAHYIYSVNEEKTLGQVEVMGNGEATITITIGQE